MDKMRRVSISLAQPTLPFIPDTDPETSIDLDKSVGSLQETKKTNLTKSVFDITVKDLNIPSITNECNAYEAHLRQELKDWRVHLAKALAELKEAKQNHPVVDVSILPKEKCEFVEQAPDFGRFLRRMQEFRSLAVKFMENDYAEILNLQENITNACKTLQNLAKENFIEERLANGDGIN